MRTLIASTLSVFILAGCDASFEDLRPTEAPTQTSTTDADAGPSVDSVDGQTLDAANDAGIEADPAGFDAGGGDPIVDSAVDSAVDLVVDSVRDTGTPDTLEDPAQDIAHSDPDQATEPEVVAPVDSILKRGTFEGRMGYAASGTVELWRLASGELEIRFLADFSSAAVPGPVGVLTTRDAIGVAINSGAGDISFGEVSPSGAQTFSVPAAAADALYAWAYCEPFGVETARAALSEVTE